MKLSQLQDIEKQVMAEVVKRRQLGGYSMEAESLLMLAESLLRVIQHAIETYPEEPKAKNGK